MTRDQLLALPDLAPVPVDVPEWGTTVLIRPWTLAQRVRFAEFARAANDGKEDAGATGPMLAAMSLCDDAGNLLFTTEADDLTALAGKSGAAVERIGAAVLKLNGIDKEAGESAGKG